MAKICPLSYASAEPIDCDEEWCAWYVDGECAIVKLVKNVQRLAEAVKRLSDNVSDFVYGEVPVRVVEGSRTY